VVVKVVEEVVMKKVLLFVVALFSISQGALAGGQSLVPSTGEVDTWRNGAVSGSATRCDEVGAKVLAAEKNAAQVAPQSSARSSSSSSAR
jgi:hypothetical protein